MNSETKKSQSGLPIPDTDIRSVKRPVMIPNLAGETYRIETVLARSATGVIKAMIWLLPEDLKPPHSHPWAFTSLILWGGYTEDRYWVDEDGSVCHERRTYRAGDANEVPAHVFHRVAEVIPGTITRMVCGPELERPWGSLDIATGAFTPHAKDDGFLERFKQLNPS